MSRPFKIPIKGRSKILKEALIKFNGKIYITAFYLKIDKSTLTRYLRMSGIDHRNYHIKLNKKDKKDKKEFLKHNRDIQRKRQENELCSRCRNKSEPNRTRCRKHLDEAAKQNYERNYKQRHHYDKVEIDNV